MSAGGTAHLKTKIGKVNKTPFDVLETNKLLRSALDVEDWKTKVVPFIRMYEANNSRHPLLQVLASFLDDEYQKACYGGLQTSRQCQNSGKSVAEMFRLCSEIAKERNTTAIHVAIMDGLPWNAVSSVCDDYISHGGDLLAASKVDD
ncbi:hypothetical protein FACS189449_13620 [Alphaproteobacteria bacterium]|nr:hypothetical protein FACS189449_13620 [Alphaproteobacteria bacterium]